MMRREVLNDLAKVIETSDDKRILLNVFKKLVVLETNCLKDNDHNVRAIGYDAQYQQELIERKLIK